MTDSAFEKGDFEAVTKYANVYLEFNSKVEAPYLYLFFAGMKIKSFEELAKLEKPFNQNSAYIELTKYWSKETKEEFAKAEAEIRGRIKAEEEKRKAEEAERKALEDKRKAEEKAKKKKKTIIIIACIIAALIIVGVVLLVYFTSDTYIYGAKDDGNGGVIITTYRGNTNQIASECYIKIPEKIGGKPVTTIGQGAFECYYSITGVSIPNTVTTIETNAFNYCTSLWSVIIPSSVTTIEDSAFNGCYSLTIHCEIERSEKPAGWKSSWSGNCPVVWGYKG